MEAGSNNITCNGVENKEKSGKACIKRCIPERGVHVLRNPAVHKVLLEINISLYMYIQKFYMYSEGSKLALLFGTVYIYHSSADHLKLILHNICYCC